KDRRGVAPKDWKQIAGNLNGLTKSIGEARKALEARPRKELEAEIDRPGATRAVAIADGLRATLETWHRFHDGYDTRFCWWNAEPYKAADEALRGYATLLRDRLGVGSGSGGGAGEDEGGGFRRRGGDGSGPPANVPGGGGGAQGGPAGRNRAAEAKED